MSLKVKSASGWPGQYKGTTRWSEKTRQAQFGEHGPLFDRVVSINEIPNLKFSVKLCFPKDYDIAKRGPDFEIKLIEGGETLNDFSNVEIRISYSSHNNIGSVIYHIHGDNFKTGYKHSYKENDDYTSNRFAKIIGHDKCQLIKVKTIEYNLSFTMTLNKQAFQRPLHSSLGKRLSEKMFLKDEFSDVKILCNGKTFPCHKVVLSNQSEVFKSMLSNGCGSMIEASTGEIKINDISADVMESLLYFLYFEFENLKEKIKINIDLLLAADKYNIPDLVRICVNHLKTNLTEGNAVEIMIKSYMINQKDLFDAAQKFVQVCKSSGKVVKMDALEEMNPNLALKMLRQAMFHTEKTTAGDSEALAHPLGNPSNESKETSMTYDEKKQLSLDIDQTSGEEFEKIVQIIRQREPKMFDGLDAKSIELDFEVLKTSTLRALKHFLASILKKDQEITENGQTSSDSSASSVSDSSGSSDSY